ncbi:type II secretion system F family protein [archaeon]|nr:type II secretion system F family protein [archaeon]
MGFVSFSYRIFGDMCRSMRPYFNDVKDDMKKANLNYTFEEYFSMTFFVVMIAFFVETVFLSFIFGFFVEPVLAILMSMILSIGISSVLFFIFYTYPATVASRRANNIEKAMPFALSYLATLSSSKVQPIVLFKSLGQFKEYGELAKESKDIANNVEIFGLTVSDAIRTQAKSTPSKKFRDILWGINSIIVSGGDMTSYLSGKNEEAMNDYRSKIRKFSQEISLYLEVYLTLIITGTIFFIVLTSIISVVSSGIETILTQTFVTFILLPVLSIMFLILIKSRSPLE